MVGARGLGKVQGDGLGGGRVSRCHLIDRLPRLLSFYLLWKLIV